MIDQAGGEITTQELAARWRRTVGTLKFWRHKKKGPPYNKRGAAVTYSMADILAYEARNKIGVKDE